ncbi:MAG: DUF4349 domain-containing protein [Sphingobacteriales bacterium]|nr:MAG: DUF4349 domain-containing protein [Sphingobacteriales bacterium]
MKLPFLPTNSYLTITVFVLLQIGYNSCNAGSERTANYDSAKYASTTDYESGGDSEPGTTDALAVSAPNQNSNGDIPTPVNPTKIIKNASLRLQVKNYADGLKQVKQIVSQFGGAIGSENEANSAYRLENNLTIRVPSQQFDTLVSQLITVASYVESKQISSEDVTEQYVDIEARMNAKKQVEARYLEILKKAVKIEEILSVERQLGLIREEIESAQGKLKYYDNRVQFSTINLNLYQQLDYTSPSPNRSLIGRIQEAFLNGWYGLIEFLVGLVYIWPFLLIAFGGIFFVYRWRKKRKMQQTPKPPADNNP